MNRTTSAWADWSSNPIRAWDRNLNNPPGWWCTKISAGCANCYAEAINIRFGNHLKYVSPNVARVRFELNELEVEKLLALRKPAVIFLCDMLDVFHPAIPQDVLWGLLDVLAHPAMAKHTLLLSTKRPDYAEQILYRWANARHDGQPIGNLRLGATVENRAALNRLEAFTRCTVAHRFVGCEPLLEELRLPLQHSLVEGVIVGCESGVRRRPCEPNWIRQIIADCRAADVPCFVKQISLNGKVSHDPAEWSADLCVRELPWNVTAKVQRAKSKV